MALYNSLNSFFSWGARAQTERTMCNYVYAHGWGFIYFNQYISSLFLPSHVSFLRQPYEINEFDELNR